jgi:hypothetical protein
MIFHIRHIERVFHHVILMWILRPPDCERFLTLVTLKELFKMMTSVSIQMSRLWELKGFLPIWILLWIFN